MPIRIYALAKDLDIDSKDLVDICTKAGVTGKGSALASLTDDEVEKIKSHLSSRSAPPAPQAPVRPAMTRPAPTRPPVIRTITSRPAASAAPSTTADESAAASVDVVPSTPAVSVATASIAAEKAPAEVGKPVPVSPLGSAVSGSVGSPAVAPIQTPTSSPLASRTEARTGPGLGGSAPLGAFTRDDYIAPTGAGGKPPMMTNRPKPSGGERKKTDNKPSGKRDTVVKLAAIPQQPLSAQRQEPVQQTQKPIMTLPPDAISRAKAGGRAPLEQFTKQQDKKRAAERAPVAKRGGAAGKGPEPIVTSPLDVPQTAVGKHHKDRKRPVGELEEDGEGKKKLAGMASARAARQQTRRRGGSQRPEDEDEGRRRSRRRLARKGSTNTAAPRKERVVISLPCTVRSLSEASGVPTAEIQRGLMGLGLMVTINADLDPEMAELLATELGMEVEFKQQESLEDSLLSAFDLPEDDPESLVTRPPIVTFLGHVDHGKTSLLDRIIGLNVVSGEAGGITQHIRAYKINKDGREISFVDTPGHEAFTEMRARGANVTDIAVLVVAADDGVMPQTEEAISHARAAGVPIVVALNKTDLPSADINKAYQDLSTHGLLPTEWGGDVEVIKTSAITGDGVDDLLETILLTAEIHDLKANPNRNADGVCLEAQQEGDRGVVAKLVVKNGTLKVGDIIVCGGASGRVKAMMDTLDVKRQLKTAGPSTPVSLTGLDIAPEAGDPFYVLDDLAQAREIAETRKHRSRSKALSGQTVRVSFEEFQRRLEEGRLGTAEDAAVLNLILRADVKGSIEAIQKELGKLDHPEVKINILQATVGGITSADVTLADASDAVIVGFNVIPDELARILADQRGVEIRRYDIIYKVTEDLKMLLEGKLKPEERIADLGRALVQRLFNISRLGMIAGCRVLAGRIERGCRIRVNRDGRGIGDYPLDSLRREKDDTKEVREGYECGIKLSGFNDLKEGDILEAYKIEEVARTL